MRTPAGSGRRRPGECPGTSSTSNPSTLSPSRSTRLTGEALTVRVPPAGILAYPLPGRTQPRGSGVLRGRTSGQPSASGDGHGAARNGDDGCCGRPAAGEGVEHAEPERGPGRGRDGIAPGRAIERRMDGATKGQIDELVTAAGAVVGRLADGGAAGSAGLVGGPVAGVRTATRLARHSQEVLVAANQLERLVIDLETGQRGFVITGQERFLGPWRAAQIAVPGQASTS